ncbi:MAG: hypothetical protein JXX14_15230, partial [Deltaproteobacteria bacterium]|nr:hypothetical protein [Deltaproteobacteria bacterium]
MSVFKMITAQRGAICVAVLCCVTGCVPGCVKSQPSKPTPSGAEEIATVVTTESPKLPVGKQIVPPSDVKINPWQPSEKCVALANDYLGRMSVAQKAGQMAQVAVRYLEKQSDIATYGIGSMLAGGSDFPPDDLDAPAWAAYIDAVKAETQNSELKIPLIFGIDAVHGNGKSTGAVVFPHNIGLGCTGDP